MKWLYLSLSIFLYISLIVLTIFVRAFQDIGLPPRFMTLEYISVSVVNMLLFLAYGILPAWIIYKNFKNKIIAIIVWILLPSVLFLILSVNIVTWFIQYKSLPF